MEDKKNGYVTVLSSNDYLIGVLALNYSLKTVKSKYGLTVLINEQISKETKNKLIENDIQIIEISSYDIPNWIIEKNNLVQPNWNLTFDKLRIFGMKDFEKLVYLDSDMYVRKNIDELFDRPHLSAVVDRNGTIKETSNYQKLTSGIMVVEPKKSYMDKISEIIKNNISKDNFTRIGDQDIIQLLDEKWENKKELHLPSKYNMFITCIDYDVNKNILGIDDICVVHFIMKYKPWKFIQENKKEDYIKYVENVLKRDFEEKSELDRKENLEFGNKYKEIVYNEYYQIIKNCLN